MMAERRRKEVDSSNSSSEASSRRTLKRPFRIVLTPFIKFLLLQVVTCMIFIIYFTTGSFGSNDDENGLGSFFVRKNYVQVVALFLVILIPILMLFTVMASTSSNTINLQSKNPRKPSELLLRNVGLYFVALLLGICILFTVVVLFGFTPFLHVPTATSNPALFQSARSDVSKQKDANGGNSIDSDWLCTKLVPSDMLNADNLVFRSMSKCLVLSIDEMTCCLVWCTLASLIMFVLPLSTLLEWNQVVDMIKLAIFEKTARITTPNIDFKVVGALRAYLLIHTVCIWLSGFVIPLDWEKDWQYFPICTTTGLIAGCIVNLIFYLWNLQSYIKDDDNELKQD